nr:MAG TPA: fumarate reductase flavoprotein subunit [Caudoviricetes sp.]
MHTATADIIVLGGGGAGLRAAIAAAELNPGLEIALVSKVVPMRSHTVVAEGGSAGVIRPDDSLDNHFDDTVSGGDWLCEQDVVEYFVEHCTEEMIQLEQWGCPWSRKDDGHINVRYFGGIKLGAGGLVHAYSDSVLTCLTHVPTVTRSRKELYLVELPFDIAGRVEATLRTTTDITVIAADYTAAGVTLTLATDPETSEQLNGTMSALTAGQATLIAAGTDWVE